MKRTGIIFLMIALLLTGCAKNTAPPALSEPEAPTWQEQYDLGIRFLSEGNYKEAIIAFTAAIKIDPKNPNTYLKLAETHIANNDLDSARAVLETGLNSTSGNELLKTQLNALSKLQDSALNASTTEIQSEDGNVTLIKINDTLKVSLTDPDLKNSYLVNQTNTRDGTLEYQWLVQITDGVNNYEVGTTYWKRSDAPKTITPYEMQSDIWIATGEHSYHSIGDAELEIQNTTMTWSFTIPTEYNFNIDQAKILGYRNT